MSMVFKYFHDNDKEVIDLDNYIPEINKIYINTGHAHTKGIVDKKNLKNTMSLDKCKSTAELIISDPMHILSNIDENIREVNIVLPKYPCIDAIISLYIVQHLIESKEITSVCKELANYSTKVELKQIEMCEENITTLYPIYESLIHLVSNNMGKEHFESEKLFYLKIEKGLKLIKNIVFNLHRFSNIKLLSVEDPMLLQFNDEYEEEINFLKNDLKKFEAEFKEFGEVEKISLPSISSNEAKIVNALFMKGETKSIFFRHWAYSDTKLKEGNSFIFTFNKGEENFCKPHLSECTIQVAKKNNIHLKDLEIFLNREEKSKREKLKKDSREDSLGDAINQANTEMVKYNYSKHLARSHKWTIRLPEYNIVRCPSEGTLLSYEELKIIIKTYMDIWISNSKLRYIIPVYFKYKNYEYVKKFLSSKYKNNSKNFDTKIKKYFHEYINRLLFQENKGDSFTLSIDEENHLELKPDGIELKKGGACDVNQYKMENVYLHILKYGVGFLIFDINIEKTNIYYSKDYIHNINLKIVNNSRIIFDHIMDSFMSKDCNGSKSRGKEILFLGQESFFTYQLHNLVNKPSSLKQKEEFIYRICNTLGDDFKGDPNHNQNDVNYFDIENNNFCGFGVNGGISTCMENLKTYSSWEKEFFIFLMALQQRCILLEISKGLAIYGDEKRSLTEILNFRRMFISFVTKGRFNQITSNKLGSILYKKWCDVLSVDFLYDEIKEQLDSLYNFNQSNFSDNFEKVSAFIFPAITLCTILGVIVETTPKFLLDFKESLLIILLGILLGALKYRK
ncbi:MAG: hypothetical protein ACRDA4_02465 [Filifactoraceae bacterium]